MFSISTKRTWRCQIGHHQVEIVKVRPRRWGGLLPNSFTVLVDKEVVAQAEGRSRPSR